MSGGTSKQWNIYASPEPSPSQTEVNSKGGQWKDFGASMDAISFGFVATAILISMFLIMAIFEHLFKPTESFTSAPHTAASAQLQKLRDPETVPPYHSLDFSVLMPGQQYPTFIAQPAPLPCPREGVCWPSHEHNFAFP